MYEDVLCSIIYNDRWSNKMFSICKLKARNIYICVRTTHFWKVQQIYMFNVGDSDQACLAHWAYSTWHNAWPMTITLLIIIEKFKNREETGRIYSKMLIVFTRHFYFLWLFLFSKYLVKSFPQSTRAIFMIGKHCNKCYETVS